MNNNLKMKFYADEKYLFDIFNDNKNRIIYNNTSWKVIIRYAENIRSRNT